MFNQSAHVYPLALSGCSQKLRRRLMSSVYLPRASAIARTWSLPDSAEIFSDASSDKTISQPIDVILFLITSKQRRMISTWSAVCRSV